jgi:hypothetical protein
VLAIEPVVTPAKAPDASCRNVPRGETPPPRCRPDNLRGEQFWRVTIDVGNKRYVARPYRTPKFIDSLNQAGPVYVDPNLAVGASVEVAVYPNQTIRIRTDQGDGLPASVDSVDQIGPAVTEVPTRAEPRPVTQSVPASSPRATSAVSPGPSKIVLLEGGDFIDLEVQELKAQDIGDGAVLFSFAGDSSQTRINTPKPVFLILGGNEAVELSRLQVGKGTRQLVYSSTRKHSASAVAATVTPVSDTTRRLSPSELLAAGEYVLLLPDSGRAFLFSAH